MEGGKDSKEKIAKRFLIYLRIASEIASLIEIIKNLF
jgi:hypothetical protein